MLQLLGDFVPQTPLLGLCPWTPLGDSPWPSNLGPPATNFQHRPRAQVETGLNTVARLCYIDAGQRVIWQITNVEQLEEIGVAVIEDCIDDFDHLQFQLTKEGMRTLYLLFVIWLSFPSDCLHVTLYRHLHSFYGMMNCLKPLTQGL